MTFNGRAGRLASMWSEDDACRSDVRLAQLVVNTASYSAADQAHNNIVAGANESEQLSLSGICEGLHDV